MTDFENLENIEACGECGTFHDARYCPMMEALYDDEAPFCELHPDTISTQVRGVEGDDIGYECPDCVKDMGEHNKALADEVCKTKTQRLLEYLKQAKLIDKALARGMINRDQHRAKLEAEWRHYTQSGL